MKLTQEQIDQINVTVDSYKFDIDQNIIECSCLIADNDYDTIVTVDEIRKHVDADNSDNIEICDNPGEDNERSYKVPFINWFFWTIATVKFNLELEDIINARENRKPLYKVVDMPTATDILNAIKDCK